MPVSNARQEAKVFINRWIHHPTVCVPEIVHVYSGPRGRSLPGTSTRLLRGPCLGKPQLVEAALVRRQWGSVYSDDVDAMFLSCETSWSTEFLMIVRRLSQIRTVTPPQNIDHWPAIIGWVCYVVKTAALLLFCLPAILSLSREL